MTYPFHSLQFSINSLDSFLAHLVLGLGITLRLGYLGSLMYIWPWHPEPVVPIPILTHPELLALAPGDAPGKQLCSQLTFSDSSQSGSSLHTHTPSLRIQTMTHRCLLPKLLIHHFLPVDPEGHRSPVQTDTCEYPHLH